MFLELEEVSVSSSSGSEVLSWLLPLILALLCHGEIWEPIRSEHVTSYDWF
jgi:hypothetical protein